jgi:glycosyltransferase involved in cell wall biosynthesis
MAASSRPLRVLVVTSSYPRWPGDLAGVFVAEQAVALAARGHQVTVLAPGGPGLPAAETNAGVAVRRPRLAAPGLGDGLFYGAGVADNLAARPLRALALGPAVAALATHAVRLARAADVLLSHWLLPSGLAAALAARATGRGHVAVEHSGGVHVLARAPRALGRALARAILSGTDHVACAGPHLAAALERLAGPLPAGALSVLPVGLHTARYRRTTLYAPPGPDDPLRVLCVARLVPVKGVDTLLRAAATAARVWLTVVGDGPQRAELEALAQRLRAPVTFQGPAPTDAVPALLHAHDVLALPSRVLPSGRTEGTPRVLLEALAAGLPVVATAAGGAPALLAGGGGVLVQPDDAAALARALSELATDPKRMTDLAEAAAARAPALDWAARVPPLEAQLLAAAGKFGESSGRGRFLLDFVGRGR